MIPAIISLVFVILGGLGCLLGIATGISMIDVDDEAMVVVIVYGMGLALHLPTLIGILSATFRWNYILAWVGFVCAAIPCTSACSMTALPIGFAIWGMVVLTDPAVRQQFRS
jgi:hypothetical protein